MAKYILHVLLDKRHETALDVQKVLTEYGCYIKTRVGLHDATPKSCTEHGLIILELLGSRVKHAQLKKKLSRIAGVKAKLVTL